MSAAIILIYIFFFIWVLGFKSACKLLVIGFLKTQLKTQYNYISIWYIYFKMVNMKLKFL